MTVKELIEALKEQDPDAIVIYESGEVKIVDGSQELVILDPNLD